MSYENKPRRPDRRRDDDQKPYSKGSNDKKPYFKKDDDRKPYFKKDDDKKPYFKKDDDRKPYFKKDDDRKPYGKRDDLKRAPKTQRPEKELVDEKPVESPDELPFIILGRNAVKEAVKSDRSLDYILVSKDMDGSLREIINLARDKNLIIREVDRRKLDEVCMPFGHGGKTANHQGICAYAAGVEYCTVGDILRYAREKNEPPFVIVLDGVEDPHNLGSIIRSAECAGAHGVIIGKRRSASVTAATVKASAGATAHMNIARVVNINGAIEELKRAKLWVAGADMAGRPMQQQGLNGALALVIGNEGEGLSKLVKDNCDFLVSIPLKGKLDSLNAAVAAAILMFEKNRQDDAIRQEG